MIMKRFSIIIPIYNEEKHLVSVVSRLITSLNKTHRGRFEIILSENGSTDSTLMYARHLARKYKFIRVIHSDASSYGQAFRRGIYEACFDTIVQFDLDFWDLNYLTRALELIKTHDIVVGSKNLSSSDDHRPLGRKITSKIIEVFIKLRFGTVMTDTHGLKVLKRSTLLLHLPYVSCPNHFFDSELLLRCEIAGAKVAELPVSLKEIRASRFSFFLRSRDVAIELFQLLTSDIDSLHILRLPTLSRLTQIITVVMSLDLVKKLIVKTR